MWSSLVIANYAVLLNITKPKFLSAVFMSGIYFPEIYFRIARLV